MSGQKQADQWLHDEVSTIAYPNIEFNILILVIPKEDSDGEYGKEIQSCIGIRKLNSIFTNIDCSPLSLISELH